MPETPVPARAARAVDAMSVRTITTRGVVAAAMRWGQARGGFF
jgi:hypothetical protein